MTRFTAYNESLFLTKSESSILALISTMSGLGDYIIYANVAGDKLAVTFHDIAQPLTVQKLDNGDAQKVCSPPSLLSLCLFSHYWY